MAGNTDYVVRLQGDSSNLNKAINGVKDSIKELNSNSDKLGAIQDKFKRIESSTAPVEKKLKAVKKAMADLAVEGQANTDVYNKMADAAKKYQAALDQVNASTKQTTSFSDLFSNNMKGLQDTVAGVASKAGLGGLSSSIGALANPYTAAATAAVALGKAIITSTADFESHLSSLKSLTGLSDESMEELKKGAIEMSKEFRSSASEIVDSMKLIGSQSPELLQDKDALMAVTESANVLAEAAQIDVVAAASAITTTMNQMGVSASESSDIINVLAAASQQGAADVEYLNTAFEKAGTMASSSGMSYTELAAAVEAVAPKFSSADVAGSQLSSTLLKLSTQANNDFNPSVVGMQQALENLSAAELSDADIKGLVGASNVTMIKTLIDAKDTYEDYTQSLTGTNTAYEQMTTNNDNLEGAVAKMKSQWDAFLLTLGETGPIQFIMTGLEGIMDILGTLFDAIGSVVSAVDEGQTACGEMGEVLKEIVDVITDIISSVAEVVSEILGGMSKAGNAISPVHIIMKALKAAVEAVGMAVKIYFALIRKEMALVKETIQKAVDYIKGKWNDLLNKFKDISFVKSLTKAWNDIYNKVAEIIDKTKKLWNDFLKWLGLEGKPETTTTATKVASNAPTPVTAEEEMSESSSDTETIRSSSARTKAIEYEMGSLADLEAKYNELNDELKNTNVSDERLKEINEEKAALEEEIDEIKLRNGLINPKEEKVETPEAEKPQAKEGSLDYINKELSNAEAQIKLEVVGSDEWNELSQRIAELTNERHTIELAIDANRVLSNTEIEDNLKKQTEAAKQQTKEAVGSISDSFSSLGSAIGGEAGSILNSLGGIANGIATLIPQIIALGTAQQTQAAATSMAKTSEAMTVVAVSEAEALAEGTASAASMPFPANIAAIAAIIATIVAVFASIAGCFAEGGIVTGGSYHGDRLLARVNAGEMILNPKQQRNLFNMLDNGGATGGMSGKVEFQISGRNLKGVLNNYDTKVNKMN